MLCVISLNNGILISPIPPLLIEFLIHDKCAKCESTLHAIICVFIFLNSSTRLENASISGTFVLK